MVLFLHGGGWRLASRRVFCPTWRDWRPDPFTRLVNARFAVASVDYRLSGEASFPAQLHDVKAAVRWLRTRAAELAVDAARIVAWGESAGGHLAALLGAPVQQAADLARQASQVTYVHPEPRRSFSRTAPRTGSSQPHRADSLPTPSARSAPTLSST